MSNTIQPQELRINNYIEFQETSQYVKVTEIMNDGFSVIFPDDEHTWIEADQFGPIPLTEEILIKCGFEKIGGEYFKKMNALQLIIRFNAGYVYSEIRNAVYLGDLIKDLHTLQNFYYTFTSGRELEIKL